MLKWVKFFILGLTLIPYFSEAQSFYAVRRNRNLLVNAGSGVAYYKGDLVDPKEFGLLKPNIAIGAEYYIFPRISARASLTWFQLAGDDKYANDDRVDRNLSFRSNNIELAFSGAFNLIPMGTRFYQRPRFNLHAWVGVGILYFNPKTKYNGEWVGLHALETEGKSYSLFQPVIPFGLGGRVRIDPFFNILIEGGYRKTFTDHLDDVSIRRYPDPASLKNDLSRELSYRADEIGSRATVRGNPENDDGYFVGNITLQYYLPTEIFRNQRKLYNSKRRANYRR